MQYEPVELSKSVSIQATKKDHKGIKVVDVRKHVKSKNYTGPTASGLWVPEDRWNKFKELVNSIEVA